MIRNIDKISTGSPFFDLHTIGVKIDHNISDRHHFSGVSTTTSTGTG